MNSLSLVRNATSFSPVEVGLFGVSWQWPIEVVGLSAILPDYVVANTISVIRHGKDT
jgi:uncharacterized integral membrane protein